jgi:hypothetical protein
MGASRVLPGGLAAAAALAVALVGAQPAAAALVNASWTGGSTSSSNWTDAGNWGGSAPASPINDLTFGDLSSCDTGSAPAGSACYSGTDNLGATAVNHIQIGGGKEYQIYPTSFDNPADTITLNGNGATPNVGISASPSGSNQQLGDLGVPISLGAAQEWDLSGGILYVNSIAGNYPLTLNLDNGFLQANDVETQNVTISGPGSLQLDQFTGSPEKLPAVTVNDSIGQDSGLAIASANATSGAISVAGTDNNFIVLTDKAPGETRLQVNGNVTLDATSNVEFDIDGNDTTAGVDASQLTSSGTVAFGGAQISLWQAQDAGNCDTLTPGKSFTVLQGATLSGQIKVGGKLISPGQTATETFQSNNCASAAKTTAIVSYSTKAITATIAGAPASTGQAPQITGTPTVGDKLTVTGNGSWSGGPTPTYSYQWDTCSGSSCSSISGATAASLTLTSAELSKTVKLQVTATNSYGSASVLSNGLGPVKAAAVTITPSLRTRVRTALGHLAHPRGRRAERLLLRQRLYRTHFSAPAAGTLSVVWRATITTGHGRHAKRHTYVIARGTAHSGGARSLLLTVRLTGAGRRLLRAHPFGLHVTASDRFLIPGSGWVTFTRRFTL